MWQYLFIFLLHFGREMFKLISFYQDHQPFVSYESLEQLHRFLFVLGVTHVSYSFLAIALAMIKVDISSSKLPPTVLIQQ